MKANVLILMVFLSGIFAVIYPGLSTDLIAQDSSRPCTFTFEAAVRHGPSAGLALIGNLEVDVDAGGSLAGKLVQESGAEVVVAGQATGRAINLIFVASEEKYIFGVGTALNNLAGDDCGQVLGGPFAGPEPGDSGDWAAAQPHGF